MINLTEPYDVYLATEVGEVSNGGISKWVDDWISNVAPHLVVRNVLIIEKEHDDWNPALDYDVAKESAQLDSSLNDLSYN